MEPLWVCPFVWWMYFISFGDPETSHIVKIHLYADNFNGCWDGFSRKTKPPPLHSADRSIKLSGSHRTQTQTSEVGLVARSSGHWVVASMFAWAIPKGPSERQLKKTSNGRRSQLNQFWSYKPHSNFKPTWNFLKILYVSFKWYFWQK